MRLRASLAAVVALVLVVVVAPEASGTGTTPITSCGQTVTTNALLTQDMYCPGSSGVVVGADGITIDLKGFTLRGDLSSSHYGVDSGGHDGVTVKSGAVRNFSQGVFGNGADKFSVSNVVASGNTFTGVFIQGAGAKVQSVTADGNQVLGILVRGNSGSVKSSTADGNVFIGMDVEGVGTVAQSSNADGNGTGWDIGANVKLQSVTGNGNSGDGVSAFGNSVSIRSSTFSGNGDVGIIVTGDSATIKGNQANGNGFVNGVSDLSGLGIWVFFTVPPVGSNTANGNDDPAGCNPSYLC